MEILVADDEKLILEGLVSMIREIRPDDSIHAFYKPSQLLDFVENNPVDVAFLDIEMGATNGISLAKKLKLIRPQVNIIFVTGYSQYMKTAFSMHVSGYIKKPFFKEDIEEEFKNLRYPVKKAEEKKLVVKCFGNFDLFVNGKSIDFERGKTKELFAYLIDRRGMSVTSGEIRTVLWPEAMDDRKTGIYLQKLKKDLIESLEKVGFRKLFNNSWNKYSINTDLISCDYYDWLNNKPEGIRAYNGEYMSQYDWATLKEKI